LDRQTDGHNGETAVHTIAFLMQPRSRRGSIINKHAHSMLHTVA